MKKMIPCLFVAVTALLVLFACQQPTVSKAPPPGLGASPEANAAQLLDLLVAAQATGDFSKVNARAAVDDPSGKLSALVGEYESSGRWLLRRPKPEISEVKLPGFGTDNLYKNGDVLVSRGSSTLPTSTAMNLVLTKGFAHAGILDLEMFDALTTSGTYGADDAPCVLSADIDFLTDPGIDADGEPSWALNYETHKEWVTNNDIITVLHASKSDPDIAAAISTVYENHPRTIYAFVDLSFNPINRDNNSAWYCSKVPWRVYHADGTNIENAGFYGIKLEGGTWVASDDTGRWTVFRDSLLYKIYSIYLWLKNPWSRTIGADADHQLIQVLGELITPDELRMSVNLTPAFYATTTAKTDFTDVEPGSWLSDMDVVWQ